jgi:hypothetical protein
MRIWPLAFLLAGCQTPYVAFDKGHDVHFILVVEGKPLEVRPVCTVGTAVRRPPARTIRRAAEVAILRVPAGDHDVSLWERSSRAGAKKSLSVDRDLWLFIDVRPGESDGRVEVFDLPPRDRTWQSLVTVPR